MQEVRALNVLGDVLMECSEDNDSLYSQIKYAKNVLAFKIKELDGCYKTGQDQDVKIMGLSKALSAKVNEARIVTDERDYFKKQMKSFQFLFGSTVVVGAGIIVYLMIHY